MTNVWMEDVYKNYQSRNVPRDSGLGICCLHLSFKFQYHRVRPPDMFFLAFFYGKPSCVSFRSGFVQFAYYGIIPV